MTLQIELLETSFQAIAPRGEAFATAFYEYFYPLLFAVDFMRAALTSTEDG